MQCVSICTCARVLDLIMKLLCAISIQPVLRTAAFFPGEHMPALLGKDMATLKSCRQVL